jgi:hypothetical protein
MLLYSFGVIIVDVVTPEPKVVCPYPLLTDPTPIMLTPVLYGVLTSLARAVVPDPAIF